MAEGVSLLEGDYCISHFMFFLSEPAQSVSGSRHTADADDEPEPEGCLNGDDGGWSPSPRQEGPGWDS